MYLQGICLIWNSVMVLLGVVDFPIRCVGLSAEAGGAVRFVHEHLWALNPRTLVFPIRSYPNFV